MPLSSCSSGGGSGGVVARDAVGQDITAEKWLATHPAGDRTLAEGLKVTPERATVPLCLLVIAAVDNMIFVNNSFASMNCA